MKRANRKIINRIIPFAMLALGIGITLISGIYVSSFFAIVGISTIFFGAILLYITPTKLVPITLLNASTTTNMNNIERLLSELMYTEKGIYLPPKNLQDTESSLVFIPKTSNQALPRPEKTIITSIFNKEQNGLFLTPPGFALSKIFEQKIGSSFTKTDLPCLQKTLSKLLTEDLEIAEDLEIQIQNSKISLDISGDIFKENSQEAQRFPQAHNLVGCFLSSSLACALAKASGKPIVIENEDLTRDGKITRIEYRIVEE